jgi:FKBP-type peptidyl-prolyl cis-trans isomerase
MKTISWKTTALMLVLPLAGLSAACAEDAPATDTGSTMETDQQKASYAIGLNMGQNMRQQGAEFELDLLFQGLKDGYEGADARLTPEEAQQVLQTFQQQMMAKQQQKHQEDLAANQAAAEAFFAQNREKEGVLETESGLQYEVLEAGAGDSPTAEDTVTVHYRGTLLDGTQFDSSYDRGEPATFPLGRVVPAWTEGLQLMKEGAKYKLYVPPALGYGERGAPPKIGPNAGLLFEVELIDVVGEEEAEGEAEGEAESVEPDESPEG